MNPTFNNCRKIDQVSLYIVPFKSEGLNYSTWTRSVGHSLIYKVVSGDHVGWGESTCKYKSIPVAIRKAKSLIGKNVFELDGLLDPDFLRESKIYQMYCGIDRRVRQVHEGLSIALWDLAGKCSKRSFYELLRRSPAKNHIEGMPVIHVREPEEMRDLAQIWYDKGFRIFKVKLRGESTKDIEAVQAIKSLASDLSILIVDVNYGYKSLKDLYRCGQALSELEVKYFQNPIKLPLVFYPYFARQSSMSFTCDNTSYWPNICKVIFFNATSLVNLHPNCLGSLTYIYNTIDYAKAHGLPSIVGGCGFFGIQDRVYQKISFTLDNDLPLESIGFYQYFEGDLSKYYRFQGTTPSLVNENLPRDGRYTFDSPDDCGFGLQVNEDYLNRLAEKTWKFN